MRSLLRSRQSGTRQAGLRRLPQALSGLWKLYGSANEDRRRYISGHAAVALRLNIAQCTPSASGIRLHEDLDACGQRQAVVDWRVQPADLHTLRGFARYLHKRFSFMGPSYAAATTWQPELLSPEAEQIPGREDARHAMGGASMGTDPRSSVVDEHLRVHGIENLSLASAAVFPDGSPQLPTLTLMALSLRLAERLREHLGRSPGR